MMTTVALNEAKERLEELLKDNQFVIRLDDGSTLFVEVKRIQKPRPVFGSGKGWVKMTDAFFEPLEDLW